jgi:Abortive infection C-terminus
MSDGHSQNYKSEKHHLILAVNSALTLVEFLFDTLEFQNLSKK